MSHDRASKLWQAADEAAAEMVRQAEESGELRHLHGRPLNLDEDSSWLGARIIRDQGFSHPTLERARDLEEPRAAVEAVAARLRRRHRWLANPETRATQEQIEEFNEQRVEALAAYAERLRALNQAVTAYNLGAPDALHQLPIGVERAVNRLAEDVPELTWQEPTPRRRWWRRLLTPQTTSPKTTFSAPVPAEPRPAPPPGPAPADRSRLRPGRRRGAGH